MDADLKSAQRRFESDWGHWEDLVKSLWCVALRSWAERFAGVLPACSLPRRICAQAVVDSLLEQQTF